MFQRSKLEVLKAEDHARDLAEQMALREASRDKIWTSVKVKLEETEDTKRNLEDLRVGLVLDNETKQRCLNKQEKKARADMRAMKRERDVAIEAGAEIEAEFAEQRESWSAAEHELRSGIAELTQIIEDERGAHRVERSGTAIKTKNFEALSVQLSGVALVVWCLTIHKIN